MSITDEYKQKLIDFLVEDGQPVVDMLYDEVENQIGQPLITGDIPSNAKQSFLALIQRLPFVGKYVNSGVKTAEEKSREHIQSLPVIATVTWDQIQQEEFLDPSPLLTFGLMDAKNNHFVAYQQLRTAKPNSEDVPSMQDIREAMTPERINEYAEALVQTHEKLKSEGGIIKRMDALGYTADRINEVTSAAKNFMDEHGEGMNDLVDIMKNPKFAFSSPLVDRETMDKTVEAELSIKIPDLIDFGLPNRRIASIPSYISATDEGLELRMFMHQSYLGIDDDVYVHENAHALMAAELIKQGKPLAAISGEGVQEAYARTVGGMSISESLFFATCVEGAYKLGEFIDEAFSRGLEGEALQQEIVGYLSEERPAGSYETGIQPVAGEGFLPLGLFMVPMMADASKSLGLQQKIHERGINNAMEAMEVVFDEYNV